MWSEIHLPVVPIAASQKNSGQIVHTCGSVIKQYNSLSDKGSSRDVQHLRTCDCRSGITLDSRDVNIDTCENYCQYQ